MNKKTILIIGTLLFIIALVGLGTNASQQMDKQKKLTDQLAVSQTKLQAIHLETLTSQKSELENQKNQPHPEFELVEAKFARQLNSTTVTAALFELAGSNGLVITGMTSSSPVNEKVEGVNLSTITLTAIVQGNADKLVNYIVALNKVLKTSTVKSVEITVPEPVVSVVITPGPVTGDNSTGPVTGDNTTGPGPITGDNSTGPGPMTGGNTTAPIIVNNIMPVHIIGENATAKIEMAIYSYRGE
jgi:hypothetical protein